MKYQDFEDAIYNAGWRPTLDGQHTNIKEVWKQLFPVVAKLEDELEEANEEIERWLADRW